MYLQIQSVFWFVWTPELFRFTLKNSKSANLKCSTHSFIFSSFQKLWAPLKLHWCLFFLGSFLLFYSFCQSPSLWCCLFVGVIFWFLWFRVSRISLCSRCAPFSWWWFPFCCIRFSFWLVAFWGCCGSITVMWTGLHSWVLGNHDCFAHSNCLFTASGWVSRSVTENLLSLLDMQALYMGTIYRLTR